MKIRSGFVSNSSSSSFILKNERDIEELKRKSSYTDTYPVNEIIKYLSKELKRLEKIPSDSKLSEKVPYFILEEYKNTCHDQINMLKDSIARLSNIKGCVITEPVDRDWAYRKDLFFEIYEGDL